MSILFVGIINFINFVIENKATIEIATHQAPFIIIGALLILYRKKISRHFTGIIFALLGIMTTLLGLEDNTGGMVFYIFAFYIFLTKTKYIIFTLALTFLAILIKSTILGFSIAESYNLIGFYIWAIIIYFDLIHPKPKPDNKITVICQELDSITVDILQKLYLGFSAKEVSTMVYLTQDAVSKRIGRAKKTMNAKNTYHLLAICQDKGYIALNMDKLT